MSASYIGRRGAASRTSTAFSRFSGRMIGWGTARAARSTAFEPSCTFSPPNCMISCRSTATPRIDVYVSTPLPDDRWKLTLSAHVYVSGKSRVSSCVKVRCSRRRSAFAIMSTTSVT